MGAGEVHVVKMSVNIPYLLTVYIMSLCDHKVTKLYMSPLSIYNFMYMSIHEPTLFLLPLYQYY